MYIFTPLIKSMYGRNILAVYFYKFFKPYFCY